MRRKCQECRLKKCLAVGMRPECVVPETQCAIKRKEKKAQRDKDKLPVSTTTVDDHMPPIMQCDPPPPEAARIVSGTPLTPSLKTKITVDFDTLRKVSLNESGPLMSSVESRH